MNVVTRSLTRAVRPSSLPKSSSRTLTTLTTPLRPTALPYRSATLAIRPNLTSFTPTTTAADIVPRDAITTNPAIGSIRCGPRNTMNGHTRLVQKRRHGWLVRKRSRTGRKILLRRKIKGRRQVAH